MKNIKLGFVGLGWIAHTQFQGIKSSKKVTLGAIADVNKDNLEKASREWGVKGYNSLEKLLKDPEIDAVSICTPHSVHAEQVMKSLEAGKHVLCEKPLSLKAEDIVMMRELAKKRNLVLMPAENFLYRPPFPEAKKILKIGELGRIIYAQFYISHFVPHDIGTNWRSKREYSGGNALLDSGIHLVNESIYLMGKPTKLSAFTNRIFYEGIESEDVALVSLMYQGGAIGSIFQGWASADCSLFFGTRKADSQCAAEVKILGTEGMMWISDALYLRKFDPNFPNADFGTPLPQARKIVDNISYYDSFGMMVDKFYACIAEGEQPLSTAQDAELALRIVQNAYNSANNESILIIGG